MGTGHNESVLGPAKPGPGGGHDDKTETKSK
jgi:hypothetical protein